MTYRADVPGDVEAPILLTEKSQRSSPGEIGRMRLNVRVKESRRSVEPAVCHNAELMQDSLMFLRTVKLAHGKRITSSGTSRKSIIGLENG